MFELTCIAYSQISFGSFHWPSVPEYVDELTEALISKKVPFVRLQLLFTLIAYDSSLLLNQILANPSPITTLSEIQAERIQLSGLGMITKWSP